MECDTAVSYTHLLHLEMSEEKTKITNSQDKARFLGYDITTAKNSALKYDSKHQLRKTNTGRIKLYAQRDKWQGNMGFTPQRKYGSHDRRGNSVASKCGNQRNVQLLFHCHFCHT